MRLPRKPSSRAAWIFLAPLIAFACGQTTIAPSSASSSSAGGAATTSTESSSASTGGSTSTTSTSTTSTSTVATSTSASSSSTGEGDAGDRDASACGTTVTAYPLQPATHIPVCSPITYSSNPPTSGPHYPIWAAFKTYSVPVMRGFYVHDLEHGGIVITYNCTTSCDDELAQLAAFLDARAADPTCTAPLRARVVVTPDPLIETRFAASAWGYALTSQCFDLPALGAFMDAHYRMGTEDFCDDGLDVASPDAGLPAGCGQETVDGG